MNINNDELFLICKKLNLKDFLNFSMVNKRIFYMIDKNWKYRLLEFKNTKNFKLEKKKLYILLTHLSNLKRKLRLVSEIGTIYGLTHLDLSNCNLDEIPKEMKALQNLEDLSLKYNSIRKIENIPITVKKLYLSYNKLKDIDEKICGLKNLELLYLGYNFIKEVPIELSKLEKLRNLSLDDNLIRNLPIELSKLINLRHLYLTNNPIHHIPKEIQDIPKINIYYNPYIL